MKIITYTVLKRVVASSLLLSSIAFAGDHRASEGEQVYKGISPDVLPSQAHRGNFTVGVKTLSLVNPQQFNVNTQTVGDRPLTIELWYPAKKETKALAAIYKNVTRTHTPFAIKGDAFRDATAIANKKFPLVVISHGYTGYRTLMFYLAEHLASHGYVVASIDHTDSTNEDVDFKRAPFSGFPSTLYNRSRDQQFVLNTFTDTHNPLSRNVDTTSAGLIGYSMGGYGAINTIGGCYQFSEEKVAAFTGVKDKALLGKFTGLLNSCAGGQYQDVNVDKKWKSAVAMAPWGNAHQVFSPKALAKVDTPILFIAGSEDDISDYASIQSLFDATATRNAYLLTYERARHNIAAHPAPTAARGSEIDFGHYWDSTWGAEQLNAVNKHFVRAMMDCHVKDIKESCAFLDLPESSYQRPDAGKLSDPWPGFVTRFSTGMQWQHKK